MAIGPNVTGWEQLMDANMIGAAFSMFDAAWGGLVVGILFIVYQIMLYYKTRNLVLCWITGAIFVSIYITADVLTTWVHPASVYIIWVLLIIELGGILYMTFFK